MFGTLLESRAKWQRRAGGSIASMVMHTAVIGGAVVATAGGPIDPIRENPRVQIIDFSPPPARPRRPTPVAPTQTVIDGPAFDHVLRVPVTVPTDLPATDMSVPSMPVHFSDRPIGSPGILCERECAPGRVSDAGNELWTANDVMMRLRENPAPPRYPESLRRAGVEGTVVVKFAVDTTGRVDMHTVEVLRSTHLAFTLAVRESLEKLRFNPSMVGERRVRALAVMPFQFTLK